MKKPNAEHSESFAISERIAFAEQLEGRGGAWEQRVIYRDAVDDVCVAADAELSMARVALLAHVARRLAELQLLSRAPLMARAGGTRAVSDMQCLSDEAPWTVLGAQRARILGLPELPARLPRHLFGHPELLMALAGQLGRDPGGNTPVAAAAGGKGGDGGSALPWSLSLVTFLPALRALRPPTLPWLRDFFDDLRPQERHVGLDDRMQTWFRDLKLEAAKVLATEGSASMCRAFLKHGAPHGLRARVWEAALCLPPLPPHQSKLDSANADGSPAALLGELCGRVVAQPTLPDVAALADVAAAAESEHFFLFEETLIAVVLAATRDSALAQRASADPPAGVAEAARAAAGGSAGGSDVAGELASTLSLLPVSGAALLAAPLCYICDGPVGVYRLYRSMHARYWCKLHALSPLGGRSPALPMLLKTFETVLQELDPEVVAHVHALGTPVASLAAPWLHTAFSGRLAVEEVLLLWDRVLGLDSLLPLPLLAVAIMCFRRQVILTCQSHAELCASMSDISQLQTVPLLQAVLFQG